MQGAISSKVAMTPLQRAYRVGRSSDLPLGGIECLAQLEFHGRQFDRDRLQAAVDRVHRHPALRCEFRLDVAEDDAPGGAGFLHDGHQPPPTVALHLLDARAARDSGDGLGGGEACDLLAAVRRQVVQSVDIGRGRNWGVALSQIPAVDGQDAADVLHLAFSLAAIDIVALGVVLDELAATYRGDPPAIAAGTPGEPHAASVEALHERLRASARRRFLRSVEAQPLLPGPDLLGLTDVISDDVRVTSLRRQVPAATWAALEARAQDAGVSTAALALTVYARVLRRWSERSDFCVLLPVLDVRRTEGVVADRTVVLAPRAVAKASFGEELEAVTAELRRRLLDPRDALTEARDAQTAGIPVEAPRCVFTYAVEAPLFSARVREVFGRPRTWGQTPQTAIDCRTVRLDDDTVEVGMDVREVALPLTVAEAILDLYVLNLEEVAATGAPRSVLPPAQAEHRKRLNSSPPHPPRLLHDGFREQVAQRPDAVAVAEPGPLTAAPGEAAAVRTSYAELDRRALALAGRIANRAPAGSVVAVQLPRGTEQVVALLATLYAGCAYLPVALDAPAARVERLRQRSRWAVHVNAHFLVTADEAAPLAAPLPRTPDDLAYVIFTSGSTGEPKGVAITHGGAWNTVADVLSRHGVGPGDVALAVSGSDFDLSVHDVFGTLAAGAQLVTLTEGETRDPFRWGQLVRRCGVTVWNSVPVLLEMLLAANESLPTLRLFLVSGDRIPLDMPARTRGLAPGSTFVAMGGATEGSIWSNELALRDDSDLDPSWPSVPYGRPLTGQAYRVVDAGQDQPDGRVGELLIGGAGVAQGYFHDPERTAAAFLRGQDGRRWYRTGDLGCWRDGLLFFVGRRDTQVKIRGHRVECGEVESRLAEQPGVATAAVVPIRDRSALGAVLVPAVDPDGSTPSGLAPGDLSTHLAADLPWYMVPTVFRTVAALPVTTNGKVDRDAVARMLEDTTAAAPAEADGDNVLARVAAVWAEELGRPVSADTNFFALGGDSLSATRMCVRLRDQGVAAELRDLFRAPVLAQFAQSCRAGAPAPETLDTPAASRESWSEWAAAHGISVADLGVQEWCRSLWAHELGLVDPADVDDTADFFALGGDSLTAARLSADLRRSGLEIGVATLFRHPRFEEFWPRCTPLTEPDGPEPSEEPGVGKPFDLSPLQLAYALGAEGVPGVVRTNPCVAVILSSDDTAVPPRWGLALDQLVAQHEVLRLVRGDDWRQRVTPTAVPDVAEIPFDLTDDQFRDLLRRSSVETSLAPAVRAFVLRQRPHELGLVFNYLALDSLSVAAVLRDLAALVAGAPLEEGPRDIAAFRRHVATALDARDAATTPAANHTDPAVEAAVPRLPAGPVPAGEAVFDSHGQILDATTVQALRTAARALGVTLNSLLLHAYGAALAAATGRPRLAVNIPAARRPVEVPDALGQFTELVLCVCGADVDVRQVHDDLGAALAGSPAATPPPGPQRQRYPVVFTSLLGSPLVEDLTGGAVRTTWTHTRTPAVLLDCQIVPAGHGRLEVRWDFPRDVLPASFVEAAFADFTYRLATTAATRDGAA